MKTILLILSLCLVTFANAQEANTSNKKLGFTFTPFGENDIARFDDLVGAGSTYGEGFFSIGAFYQNALLKDWLKFETGIEYSQQKIRTKPAPNPPFSNKSSYSDFSLVTIPLDLKAEFLRFLFVEGGGILDIHTGSDAQISSQNGLGLHFGYGVQYELESGWTFAIRHYARVHSLVPFMGDSYQQHVWENGVSIGFYMPLSVFSGKNH